MSREGDEKRPLISALGFVEQFQYHRIHQTLLRKQKKLYIRLKEKKQGGWVAFTALGVPKSKKSRIRLIDVIDNAALDAPSSSE